MSEAKLNSSGLDERRKQIGLWAAGIFTIIGLAFFGYSAYTLFFAQQGQAGIEDKVLLPVTILMFVVSVISFFLIRRDRFILGIWLLISANLIIPTILGVLVLRNIYPIVITYLITLITLLVFLVFPRASRWQVLVATALTILAIIGIELWNPAFRGDTANLSNFTSGMVILAALGFLAFFVRQSLRGNLRIKLLAAFISVTLISTGILGLYVFNSTANLLQQSLEREFTERIGNVSNRIADVLNEQIQTLTALSLNEILQQTVEDSNRAYTGSLSDIQAEIAEKDARWQAADAADNNNDPLVREHLTNPVALDLLEFQSNFPNHVEIFITDVYGGLAGTTNRTSDYSQADEEWWQTAYNQGQGAVYISEPEYDESTRTLAVLIALPLRSRDTGKVTGILRTTFLASAFAPILAEPIGETGETDIFFSGKDLLKIDSLGDIEELEADEYEQIQAIAGQGMAEMDYEGTLSVVIQVPVQSLERDSAVNQLGWLVVISQHRDEAFAPLDAGLRTILIVLLVVVLFAVAAAIIFAQFLSRPLVQLTKTAQEIAAGNFNSQAQVTSSDEIGVLAGTFNSMTAQLRELIGSLEGRVVARTKDLATVAEVGTATATILETDKLLQAVVDLTKERFDLYHSHIYLLDPAGENLVLASGAGEPGRQMMAKGLSISLDREQSLVARAARERKGVIVNDVTEAPDFLPNPLLPETRSELAVPMIVGGKVIGVFDVQSDQVGRFTDSDINIQTTLAAQVSTSIQNVRSFEQAKSQADLESLTNAIGQKIQRTTSVEEAMQTAIREVGLALGATRVSASIQAARESAITGED